jgi:hypothetical protein
LQKKEREVVVVLVLDTLDHFREGDEGLIHVVGGQDQGRGGAPEIGDVLVPHQGDQGPDPNTHVPDREIGREDPEARGAVVEVVQDLDLIAEDVLDPDQGDRTLNQSQNQRQRVMRNQGTKRTIKRIEKMIGKKKRKMIRKRRTPRKKTPKRKVIQKESQRKLMLKMNLLTTV